MVETDRLIESGEARAPVGGAVLGDIRAGSIEIEHPAGIRTVVLADGDICVSVSRSLLGSPFFDTVYRAHRDSVAVALADRLEALVRFTTRLRMVIQAAGLLMLPATWYGRALDSGMTAVVARAAVSLLGLTLMFGAKRLAGAWVRRRARAVLRRLSRQT